MKTVKYVHGILILKCLYRLLLTFSYPKKAKKDKRGFVHFFLDVFLCREDCYIPWFYL